MECLRGETDFIRYGAIYDESYNSAFILLGLCFRVYNTHSQYGSNKEGSCEERYPKETMGYYFYFPPENKIVVARYVEFFKKRLINQEISGRAVDLEEIQEEEDTIPSEITRNIPQEVEDFEPPQEEVIQIRRSGRTHRAPNHLCLNVEVEEHSLGDLNEPTSYKAAMLDSESNKWIDAMNAEIQSMMDNMIWVDL
ncbi:hypothetical protein Tco_1358998 [Tanacetum coccineum]